MFFSGLTTKADPSFLLKHMPPPLSHLLPSHTSSPLTPPPLSHLLPSHTSFPLTHPPLSHLLPSHTSSPLTHPSLSHILPSHTSSPLTPPPLSRLLPSHIGTTLTFLYPDGNQDPIIETMDVANPSPDQVIHSSPSPCVK